MNYTEFLKKEIKYFFINSEKIFKKKLFPKL